jgi:integrase
MRWQDLPAFMGELSKRNSRSAKALGYGILTAARSGEVCGMTWGEIDLKDGVWTVPAVRMKASKEHRVPLTAQALELLGEPGNPEASVLGGPGMGRPLSLLQRMGYDDLTVHGFRSTFRDWAGETTNYTREVIEEALAHRLKDKSEAAYARGDLFMKRRALMQDWANYATGSKGTVTVLRQPAVMHALGGG